MKHCSLGAGKVFPSSVPLRGQKEGCYSPPVPFSHYSVPPHGQGEGRVALGMGEPLLLSHKHDVAVMW